MQNVDIENIINHYFSDNSLIGDICSAHTLNKFKKLKIDMNSFAVESIFNQASIGSKRPRRLSYGEMAEITSSLRSVKSHVDFI